MQITINEKEVKKAIETYLLQLHGLTVKSDLIKFTSKQDKAITLNGATVTLEEKELKGE